MADKAASSSVVLNTSDPGTGKTYGTLLGYMKRRRQGEAGRALVVAPLTILEPSWGADILEFTTLKYTVAHGSPRKREVAFESDSDIVLINHDGIKALVEKKGRGYVVKPKFKTLLEDFTDLIIDEFTAFKNYTSQRSKAMFQVAQEFSHRTGLSGTPTPNTVLDIWHPMMILDGGARLGARYFKFRQVTCNAVQTGPGGQYLQWIDKESAPALVAAALEDVTIRFKFEDCVDIPPNRTTYRYVPLPTEVRRLYQAMQRSARIQSKDGQIVSAVHAASKVTKMLQVLTGATYDENGDPVVFHSHRYDLVLQLVLERPHSLVAFNWQHEKDGLVAAAEREGISFAVIDGNTPYKERVDIVKRFQAGEYRVIFCHPQTTGHGLTLTKGTTVIWNSATSRSEWFRQFNRRIYRTGQTLPTETICIAAEDTKEQEIYEVALAGKIMREDALLEIFTEITDVT